jgi:hypothetical protein
MKLSIGDAPPRMASARTRYITSMHLLVEDLRQ